MRRSVGQVVSLHPSKIDRLVYRMAFSSRMAFWSLFLFSIVFNPIASAVSAQGVASLQSGGSRPFVTGVTPVIGPSGAVGGIQVDARGLVTHIDPKKLMMDRDSFRKHRRSNGSPSGNALAGEALRRVISLSKLDAALARLIDQGSPVPSEMLLLAGLRRIEFVVSDLDSHDVLIVGPAGDWETNQVGEIRAVSTTAPLLRLEDLIECLRAARRGGHDVISCSIEPTKEGQQRFFDARSRMRGFHPRCASALESAMGDQRILLGGVATSSRFAQVLVAADVAMKRLAMGHDESPVENMPSYLELLKSSSVNTRITSPRWWMVPEYPAMNCSANRLVWRVHGTTVQIKTMTQDSILRKDGTRDYKDSANALAQRWADSMTEHYEELSREIPVFAELTNCINVAVVSSLIAHEGLDVQSDCNWTMLTNASRLSLPKYQVPERIESKASLMANKAGWVVSVSGGVEVNPWKLIENVNVSETLPSLKDLSFGFDSERWWWDAK